MVMDSSLELKTSCLSCGKEIVEHKVSKVCIDCLLKRPENCCSRLVQLFPFLIFFFFMLYSGKEVCDYKWSSLFEEKSKDQTFRDLDFGKQQEEVIKQNYYFSILRIVVTFIFVLLVFSLVSCLFLICLRGYKKQKWDKRHLNQMCG